MSPSAVKLTTRRPLVWITDDSPVEAQFTERALGPDFDFEHFPDGSVVVERLAAGGRQPDVLLLDWVMPAMSGDEVVRFLRSRPSTHELPVIMVTASRIETKDVVEGLSIGANDYVARPFAPEELRARVDAAIRAKRLRETALRERNRLAAVGKLGRAFIEIGTRVEGVIAALVTSLVDGLCDGCAITVLPGATAAMSIARHRSRQHEHLLAAMAAITDPCTIVFSSSADAKARLPSAYHPAIDTLGISSLAVIPFPARSPIAGVVTVMRDGHSEPFEPEDLATVNMCIEYAAMAFDNGLRMEAERTTRSQLQTILEQLPVGIIVAEPTGHITHINQSALELIPPLAQARHVDDLTVHALIKDRDGEAIPLGAGPLGRALAGETIRGLELTIRIPDHAERHVRAAAVPLHDARGQVAAAVVALDDVTSEHAAAQERARAAEFQHYVLGIVSHDLRTPIHTVQMGLDALRMNADDTAKVLQVTNLMQSTTQRMRSIIEQLLDVTRARLGGGIPVERAETDLGGVVSSVIQELALAYPTARIEPKLEPVRGEWDPDRLAQVVANLVGNAIQHGQPAAPVQVETAREGDQALLKVTNLNKAGRALTDEQKARFFAPFRSSSSEKGSGKGLGLGLYIAKEILEAHQGAISVESNPSVTTFVVRLPIHG
jgi:signal transduction histidine kinase/CheY-like chemotaxis protein